MKAAIRFVGSYCAHGDLNIFACEQIPKSAKRAEPGHDGRHVLAHSETGHHHVVDAEAVEVFHSADNAEFEAFLRVALETDVIHLRGFDTHAPITLPPGEYRITRQREYTPEGYRLAAD